MNKINFFNFLFCAVFSSGAFAADVLVIDLKKKLSAPLDLYQLSGPISEKNLTPLSQVKRFQMNGEYERCASTSAEVYNSEKIIQGWVALTWMQCLDTIKESTKKNSLRDKAVKSLESYVSKNQTETWSKELRSLWLKYRLESLEQQAKSKSSPAVVGALGRLLNSEFSLDKSQTSKVYELLAEQAYLKKSTQEAKFFFLLSSQYNFSTFVQERLRLLGHITEVSKSAVKSVAEPVEVQIEKRIAQNLQQKNLTAALDDVISLLKDYPGSRVTLKHEGKPLEIYAQATSEDKEKILKQLSGAPSTHLTKWVRHFHRRSDFKSTLTLAKAAFSNFQENLHDTELLWIAGRSAHVTGEYSVALHYFEKLMSSHAGTTEAAEAQFRSGLIYLRQSEFASSSAMFERLIGENIERYNLSARYWNVRALEAAKSPNFQKAAEELIALFPWTYYGLRLSAELNKNSLSWPKEVVEVASGKTKSEFSDDKLYLVGAARQAWLRFQKLSENGWVNEAHLELNALPTSIDARAQILLAERLHEQRQYFQVIRLINSAQDGTPNLISEKQIRWAYPITFDDYFKNEEKRHGISTVLLRSLSRQESGFYMRAVSTSKAMGLMQMVPPTAQEIADQLGIKVQIPEDLFRPETNITMGSHYVAKMVSQFQKNIPFALAAYNAGPRRIKEWVALREEIKKNLEAPTNQPFDEIWYDELPWSETSFYVKAILRNIFLYRLVEKSPVLVSGPIWADLLEKKAK